jgi:Zn-dependent protease
MNYKLYLGRISGIKLFVHWTFLLLIGWVIYSDVQSGLNFESVLWSLGFVFAIFGCVTLHELGHSLTAQRYHIRTRDITLLPIGGVASLESIPKKPSEELAVALAGPAVNVLIALLLLPVIYFGSSPDVFEGIGGISHSNFLTSLLSVNISLVVFNMIPAFPMDGGRVLRALLGFKLNHRKATTIAARIGQVIAVIFVAVGFYENSFLIFIGIFIFMGAQSELRYARDEFSPN